jgi:RHS repeat-associated protein
LLGTAQAFAYDAVGNRTTAGNVTNAGNQLTADATHAYQYDDNGNLIRKTLLATGNYTQYTYDAENRLTKVEEFMAGNPTPAATSTYRYDGLGRRIEKVANGQTKRYVYDGEDILLEYDGSNVLQARYTHGPGIDEPIAVTKGSSTYFYHQDGLGSVTDLTDAAGATAKSYAYDAYGNILESPGTLEQPYTYTGREFDNESGLYYYRARYYDPATGRFLQKDPIGVLNNINLYPYTRNNSTNLVDPLGLIETTVDAAIRNAIGRGNTRELQELLDAIGETASPGIKEAAKKALERLTTEAEKIIAKECKGSVRAEFPEELKKKTLEEIFELAKKGDPAARTARKLLTDNRFKK